MAVLSKQDVFEEWRDFMRKNTEELSLSKSELRAVFDAADVEAQDSQGAYNAALPLPGRTALSTTQTADIRARILRRRVSRGI